MSLRIQSTVDAQELLNAMSVEERVGQLFLVTFQGDAINGESDIVDLILNYKVGGVVMLARERQLYRLWRIH